jgi:hypothetical protein
MVLNFISVVSVNALVVFKISRRFFDGKIKSLSSSENPFSNHLQSPPAEKIDQ